MKSNLRITAAARVLSLFMACIMLVTGCGSANTGDTSVGMNTETESATGDSENVSVEKEEVDIVGDPSETESESTTENTSEVETETDSEVVTPEPEPEPEPELTAEEQEWLNYILANVDNNLNVREEPSTDGKIVGKLERGDRGTIIEKGEEWTKIKSGNVEGYVSNEYCLFGLEALTMAKELYETIATVTEGGLRVRAEKSLESKVITKLAKGESIIVNTDGDSDAEWIAVIYNDKECFVSAQYVTLSMDVSYGMTNAEIKKKKEEEAAAKKAAEAAKQKAKYEAAVNAASDLDLLAALIYCEAGAECYDAQLAVGACVVNRMEHKNYPNTIKGVIYQKGQFTPAGSGKVARILINKKATASCYKAAAAALAGEDNTNGCRSFRLASTGRKGIVYGRIVFF